MTSPSRRPWTHRLLPFLAWSLCAVAALALLASASGWMILRASLPVRDGAADLPGLTATVRVSFDALGVPALEASTRPDLARALGYLHAQDRFFQMDLMRRDAAGELAELLGPALLPRDRVTRRHRFRDLAQRALGEASAAERAGIEAYAQGVNAGLASLGARPFEYFVLRTRPAPWKPEDTMLCTLAMFIALQDDDGHRESSLGVMHDVLPAALFAFLAPGGTEWDAPVEGAPFPPPPLPGPDVIRLRAGDSERPRASAPRDPDDLIFPGSNNWAVAGRLSATGSALLANDMHLGLHVPNIWYRAAFVMPDRRVTGVTLPGAPVMIVGSNGRIAWGYTNSYGDWLDLVELETDPADPEVYRTPSGPRRFDHHAEILRVAGGKGETLDVAWTIWGPVIDQDHRGRKRALRWVAHDTHAVNAELTRLETVASVEEALRVAPEIGIPEQNFVVADRDGHIGWTIIGVIPRRFGYSDAQEARLPASWADGTRGWNGWLPPEDYPRLYDPPSGRIWTANARVVEGEPLRRMGDGGYDTGARAGQIRDDLMALHTPATEADMLAVQLDDRAIFLQRWQKLLLDVLTPEAVAAHPRRAAMRREVASWGARAAVDSAGYRLVRVFRMSLASRVFEPLTAACKAADPRFDFFHAGQYESSLWALVTQRPIHLLDPAYATWDDALLAAVDATIDQLARGRGGEVTFGTWGERNTTRIVHPLALAIPALQGWLGMTPRQLPGDSGMPRVQAPSEGASERMAVSPGHETQGYLHMPGGQSGHPLSPHFADGHAAWETGEPTSFLPGPAASVLVLRPAHGGAQSGP